MTGKRIPPPNYTQVPNVLIDEIMAGLTGAEFKVLTFIARQTFGWQRDWTRNQYATQECIARVTGLSAGAVKLAIKSLRAHGLIESRRLDKVGRGGQGLEYRLVVMGQPLTDNKRYGSMVDGQRLPILLKETREKETGTDSNESGAGTNGVPVAAPLAAHTNGSTQPEHLASPALPSVNGQVRATDLGADAGDPPVMAAQPKPRSARNGKANANGSTPAEPDGDPSRAAESKLVFGELCAWLGLDWQRLPANTRGRLNKTAANIIAADLGVEDVTRARHAWAADWRGKQGQAPGFGQLEDLVAQAVDVRPRDLAEIW